jgi:NADH-quinone oxidoreductase subunit N
MTPLVFDLALVLLTFAIFLADLFMPREEKRSLAVLAAVSLGLVLVGTFLVDARGEAFGGSYVVDGVSIYLRRVFLVAGIMAVLVSLDPVDASFPAREGEYYVLLLASVLGMMVLSSARELMLLIIAFELMGMPLYVLTAISKGPATGEAAIKLYLVGAVSTAITLYGLGLIYGVTGTTSLPEISTLVSAGTHGPMLSLGLMVTLAGVGFKLGLVPFHMWVPDTYQGAPTPFVAFLSVAPKAAGFAALIRLYVEGFMGERALWAPAFTVVCVVTLLVGNVLAIQQSNVKRLLAYSGIGQVGFMLLGLLVVSPGHADGLGMLLFYLAAYVFTNMGAFTVVAIVGERTGGDDLAAYKGMAKTQPGLALAMLVFLLSLGGIPFVVGFWAKLGIFMVAYKAGLGWLVLLGAVVAVVGVFYYMRVARMMYMEDPVGEAPVGRAPLAQKMALVVAFVGVVGMGVFPGPFMDTALQAARVLVK